VDRPRGPNQLAKMIVDIAPGEVEDTVSEARRHGVGEVGGVPGARLHDPVPQLKADTSSTDRPPCLKNPHREAAEYGSLPKTATLHFTLNQDNEGWRSILAFIRAGQDRRT
jgi:hypothetical protein